MIIKFDVNSEYYTEERCYINELSNSEHDKNLSVARARVEPGVTTRWHQLADTTERYVIVEGSGEVDIGNAPTQQVSVGDVVLIPADCRQRIRNTSDRDLVFLAICTPRFKTENYSDTGDSD